ncbi:MAG: ABC transporter substrate-binding protein [Candidatus Acidiferrum sp.]
MSTGNNHAALRIVSLAPSATSILFAIGAKKYLVGVTKWCADVAPVDGLPRLGDCWHMKSVTEILKLAPSLVIGSVPYKQETVAKLLEYPLTFLATNPRTLADVENDIRMLSRIAGRATQGERLIRKMRQEFAGIVKKSGAARKSGVVGKTLRVYCEAWPHPRISSPPWVAEIVRFCGGEMVLPTGERVTDQKVADARPDVMVLAWAATGGKSRPQKCYEVEDWKALPAIRNKRVHVVRDELLNTPGPPLVAGAKQLFRIFQDTLSRMKDE